MLTLSFLKLRKNAVLPSANGADACALDLCAVAGHRIATEASLIDTGLVLHPDSYDAVRMLQLSLRSGFALKNSVVMVNAPGIVETSYTGFVEGDRVMGIGLAVACLGRSNRYVSVEQGQRIAQMLVYSSEGALLKPGVNFVTKWHNEAPVSLEQWQAKYEGRGGFGSTGA